MASSPQIILRRPGRHVRPASELKRVVAPVPERLGLGPETAPVLTPPPFKASPLAVSRT